MGAKHDELAADLADFLRSKTDRLTWTDMQLGPAGTQRPDVYTLPLSFSRFTPIAYECKVSLADFRSDVTSGKWQGYLRYAAAVIFAAPEGLIGKADIPEGCGLIVRGQAGWRTVKAPTLRPVENLPRDAWIKLLIDGIKREVKRNQPEIMSVWASNYRLRESLGNDVSDLPSSRMQAKGRYEDATERLRSAAEDAKKEYNEQMARARDRAEHDAGVIHAARSELAVALGLTPNAGVYEITSAATRAVRALERDAVVADLRRRLDKIREAVAETETPHIAKEAA